MQEPVLALDRTVHRTADTGKRLGSWRALHAPVLPALRPGDGDGEDRSMSGRACINTCSAGLPELHRKTSIQRNINHSIQYRSR